MKKRTKTTNQISGKKGFGPFVPGVNSIVFSAACNFTLADLVPFIINANFLFFNFG